jgi:MarR family transcriptional regulator, lower aerobic nicotinate degradation pathway regulator
MIHHGEARMSSVRSAREGLASPTTDALVQLSFAVHAILSTAAADRELSLIQLRMIGVLRDRRPTMQELAQHLGLTKSSLSGLVDRAEARGLVRRTGDATDGRTVRVELTRRGHSAAARVTATVNAHVDQLLVELTAPQRDQLTRLCGQILESLDHPAQAQPPGEASASA